MRKDDNMEAIINTNGIDNTYGFMYNPENDTVNDEERMLILHDVIVNIDSEEITGIGKYASEMCIWDIPKLLGVKEETDEIKYGACIFNFVSVLRNDDFENYEDLKPQDAVSVILFAYEDVILEDEDIHEIDLLSFILLKSTLHFTNDDKCDMLSDFLHRILEDIVSNKFSDECLAKYNMVEVKFNKNTEGGEENA